MYVYIYIYIYVYIYMYMCNIGVYIYIYIHIHTYIHTYNTCRSLADRLGRPRVPERAADRGLREERREPGLPRRRHGRRLRVSREPRGVHRGELPLPREGRRVRGEELGATQPDPTPSNLNNTHNTELTHSSLYLLSLSNLIYGGRVSRRSP